MLQHSSVPLRRALILIVLALCFAPACKVAEAHTYNLRQLHEEGGRHKRLAAQMGDTEYVFRSAFAQLFHPGNTKFDDKTQERIDDPLSVCVKNLIALSKIEPANESAAALQVEYFARYAVLDPWQISRHISTHRLGLAGARLKLGLHPPPTPTGTVATPDDVRAALAPLISAVAPKTSKTVGEKPVELAAACRGMAQLNYDFDGVLRALPLSAFVLQRTPSSMKDRQLVLDLVLDLERRTVQLALDRARSDTSPLVRAAALEASVRAMGPAYLAQLIPRLGTEPEEEIQMALLAMIRSVGLPSATSTADDVQNQREGELALVYKVATEHPVDRVRVSAMATLGEISGSGFKSLREDEWQSWWLARTQPTAR